MNFYKLDNANESDITGPVYPQISEYGNWCYDNYNYLVAELGPDRLPEKDFILDYLQLDSKALLTDFLSVYNPIWGFLCSDRVKQVFHKFILPQHKYFKAIVKANDHNYDNYNWLYMVSNNIDKVDFEKSTFNLMKGLLPVVLDTKVFASVGEINEFEKSNRRIKVKPREIYIAYEKINTDIFQIRAVNFDWIITQKLADALITCGVTGYQIRQIEWLKSL